MSSEAKTLASEVYQNLLNKITINKKVIDDHYLPLLISKINSINEVTLEDKAIIEECEEMYNLLSEDTKAKVTNYNVLVEARKTYDNLYTQWLASNPIEEMTYFFGQVTGFTSSKYVKDATMTYNNKSFIASSCYKSGAEFRLGHNSSPVAYSKFTSAVSGIKSQSASLESQFEMTGQKLTLETYNSYGTVNNIYLLKSTDSGTTYTLVGTKTALTNNTIEFDIQPGKARYAIVIDGSSNPRFGLISLKIS